MLILLYRCYTCSPHFHSLRLFWVRLFPFVLTLSVYETFKSVKIFSLAGFILFGV